MATGYTTKSRYEVARSSGARRTVFTLRRTSLAAPFVKTFPLPAEELRRYREALREGWSVGAYDGARLVGLAVAERRAWNRSLWVHVFGVDPVYRRRGIGRALMDELTQRARSGGLRTIVCETQSTNVPAIDFYRRVGFTLDGIDLTYYSNEDVAEGEVALFMKRRVSPRRPLRRTDSRTPRRTSK